MSPVKLREIMIEKWNRRPTPPAAPVESVPAPAGLDLEADLNLVRGALAAVRADLPTIGIAALEAVERIAASLSPRPATGARPMKLRAKYDDQNEMRMTVTRIFPNGEETEFVFPVGHFTGKEIAYRINSFEAPTTGAREEERKGGDAEKVRTLRCMRCQWEGEPEDTDQTEDEAGMECPKCQGQEFMELPDREAGDGSPEAPATGADPARSQQMNANVGSYPANVGTPAAHAIAWDERWGAWLAQMPSEIAREIVLLRRNLQNELCAPATGADQGGAT